MNRKILKIASHVVIIILLFLFVSRILTNAGYKYYNSLLITDYLIDVFLFYFIRYLLLPFLVYHENWFYWLIAIPFISLFCFVLYYLINGFWTLLKFNVSFSLPSFRDFEFSLFPTLFCSVFASLSFYLYWSKQKGIELIKAELLRQRALVNPHFTLNVLNSFYLPTLETNPELAQKMLVFGEILRFALEKGGESGMISLQDELDILQHHIELYQFMNRNQKLYLDVRLDIETYAEKIMVPPMVTVTFVENMFKYGDLSKEAHPGKITIRCNKKLIEIHVFNKKMHIMKSGTRVGIANINFRLKYAYGKNFKLDITEDQTAFQIDLIIKL